MEDVGGEEELTCLQVTSNVSVEVSGEGWLPLLSHDQKKVVVSCYLAF